MTKRMAVLAMLLLIVGGSMKIERTLCEMQYAEEIANVTNPDNFKLVGCIKLSELQGKGADSTTLYIPAGSWMPFDDELCQVEIKGQP